MSKIKILEDKVDKLCNEVLDFQNKYHSLENEMRTNKNHLYDLKQQIQELELEKRKDELIASKGKAFLIDSFNYNNTLINGVIVHSCNGNPDDKHNYFFYKGDFNVYIVAKQIEIAGLKEQYVSVSDSKIVSHK